MSSYTVDLYTIIESELLKMGYNEHINNDEWTFFNPEYQFMSKILAYDEDIQKIVNNVFFIGYGLPDKDMDESFKKTFLNKFLRRTINRQTIEDFSMQVVYTFLANIDYITNVYEINDFLMHKKITESTTDGKENTISNDETLSKDASQSKDDTTSKEQSQSNDDNTTDNRSLRSELPQTEVNLNVDNTVLDYGDENTITRNKDRRKNDSSRTNETNGTNESNRTNETNRNNETNTDRNSNTDTVSIEFNLENLNRIKGMLERVFYEFDKNCFMQSF